MGVRVLSVYAISNYLTPGFATLELKFALVSVLPSICWHRENFVEGEVTACLLRVFCIALTGTVSEGWLGRIDKSYYVTPCDIILSAFVIKAGHLCKKMLLAAHSF